MTDYVLGVDIGSGSVKLTLLSREGVIAATAGCEYPTYYPQVGWCEQEPEDWCRAFKCAFADILKAAAIRPEQIRALSFDAATHTAVLLDENRQVLRRAILWTDQRSKDEVQELKDTCLDTIMDQAVNAPTTVWTLPQLMWLRKHEPEIWGQIRYLLFAKDYLRFRMTGTMETDTIDAEGSMFYDTRRERWSEELCAVGSIRKEWLPRLCRPTDVAGTMTGERAAEFGLAEGTRVLVGTTDTVMELFAAGNVEPGHATVKLATAGRICIVTDHALDSKFIFNYRHVVPGLWYPGTATASCAASYRWYRDTIGREPFSELNVPAEKIAPGSDGLMFHPYLNGELTPYNDPDLKGSYTAENGVTLTWRTDILYDYVIYRDGKPLATAAATASEDREAQCDGADHVYQVTARYGDGSESAPVEAVVSMPTGIDVIETTVDAPRSVYSLDGVKQDTNARLQRGVYIKNGKKVIVR